MSSIKAYTCYIFLLFSCQQSHCFFEQIRIWLSPETREKTHPLEPQKLTFAQNNFIKEGDEEKRKLAFKISVTKESVAPEIRDIEQKGISEEFKSYKFHDGTSFIHLAILTRNSAAALEMLQHGFEVTPEDWQTANILYRDSNGRIPHKYEPILNSLQKHVEQKYNLFNYPLYLNRGGSNNGNNDPFNSPNAQLINAVGRNDTAKINQLFSQGSRPNDIFNQLEALDLAVSQGHEESVATLLSHDDVTIKENHFETSSLKEQLLDIGVSDYDDRIPQSEYIEEKKRRNRIENMLKAKKSEQERKKLLLQQKKDVSKTAIGRFLHRARGGSESS